MNKRSPGQTRTQCHAHPERGSRCSSIHGSNQLKGDSDSAQSATLAPAGQTSSPHINDPNLLNERRFIHTDDPNLTNERRFIHADIPNLSNERRFIREDIPNLSNERRFIHADIPNLTNERPYTNTDDRTTSPLMLSVIPLRCLARGIAAQKNTIDLLAPCSGRCRYLMKSCLCRRYSRVGSTQFTDWLPERTIHTNTAVFIVFRSGNMPTKFEELVMLFSTLLTSVFMHVDDSTRFKQVHCRT